MPISKANKALYPREWPAISKRVREEAGQRCEQCRAPNRQVIARGMDGTYMLMEGEVFCAETGEARGMARGSEYPLDRMVAVVLTVAHLNHDPTDNRRANLKALCQRCHNRLDAGHRARNAAATRRKRRGLPDLFDALAERGGPA